MLNFHLEDKSAQYLDELEKVARKCMRRTGKNRAKNMVRDARKKTGAMARGVTSEYRKGKGQDVDELEVGGTERKTPWIEEGTKDHRAYPFIKPNFEGIEKEFETELVREADKIRDLV